MGKVSAYLGAVESRIRRRGRGFWFWGPTLGVVLFAERAVAADLELSVALNYTAGTYGTAYQAWLMVNWAPSALVSAPIAAKPDDLSWFGSSGQRLDASGSVSPAEAVDWTEPPDDIAEAQWLAEWAAELGVAQGAVGLSEHVGRDPVEGDTEPDSDTANVDPPNKPTPRRPVVQPTERTWIRELAAQMIQRLRAHTEARQNELEGLSSRSRAAALLPLLRLRAGRSADQSLRYSPTTSEPDRWLQAGGADLKLEAQATWALDRLVFTHQELSVQRFQVQQAQLHRQNLRDALTLLFSWERARQRLLGLSFDDPERALLWVELLEAELGLDVLTDGWFGRRVRAVRSAAD